MREEKRFDAFRRAVVLVSLWVCSACSGVGPAFSNTALSSAGASGAAGALTGGANGGGGINSPNGTAGSIAGTGAAIGGSSAPGELGGATSTGSTGDAGSGASIGGSSPTGSTTTGGATATGTTVTTGGTTTISGVGGSTAAAGSTEDNGTGGTDFGGSGGTSASAAGSGGSGLPNPLGAPQVFIDRCAACHGVDAKGTDLAPEVEHAALPLLEYYVRNGDDNTWTGCVVDDPSSDRPCDTWGDQRVMTAFDTTLVTDADLTAITDWLDALPKPTTGAELYADFCSYCHGPGGDIPAFTYYVKASGPVTEPDLAEFQMTLKQGLTADRTIDERSRYMPPFGAQLSDAEIQLVADWMCTQSYATRPAFCN